MRAVYHAVTPLVMIVLFAFLMLAEWDIYQYEVLPQKLKVSYLDIGQGDSILIQTPAHQSLLIDGGPPKGNVLSAIGKVLPFYKHHIDMVMPTHPDQDHIAGIPNVIDRYHPQLMFESGVHSGTWIDTLLQKNDISRLLARKGMKIIFDKDTSMEILFPDRDVSSWVKKTNDASIVSRLVYKNNSFLFTGDSPINIEKYLVRIGALVHTDVLKVGHHGSRTSTSPEFVDALTPSIAVISSGKNNKYGHPHKEVVDILNERKIKMLRTDEEGTITVESDGKNVTTK